MAVMCVAADLRSGRIIGVGELEHDRARLCALLTGAILVVAEAHVPGAVLGVAAVWR
jgi:membrane-bound ClpP family serine protease